MTVNERGKSDSQLDDERDDWINACVAELAERYDLGVTYVVHTPSDKGSGHVHVHIRAVPPRVSAGQDAALACLLRAGMFKPAHTVRDAAVSPADPMDAAGVVNR